MFSGKATLPVSMKKVNITSKVLSLFTSLILLSENQVDTVHVRYQVQLRFARTAIEAELVNLNQFASQQVVAKVFASIKLLAFVLS